MVNAFFFISVLRRKELTVVHITDMQYTISTIHRHYTKNLGTLVTEPDIKIDRCTLLIPKGKLTLYEDPLFTIVNII